MYSFLKRSVDIGVSVLLLAASAPLVLVLALLVKLDSSGSAFYHGERIGRQGKPFRMHKLRTMVTDADATGPAISSSDDPRITRVGRFLRRTKLDELPQLMNVLAGDMALVGPRPEDPRFLDVEDSATRRVLSVRPGLTSPASIAFFREEELLSRRDLDSTYRNVVRPAKVAMDLNYLTRRSFLYDLAIISRTFGQFLAGDGLSARRISKAVRRRVPWFFIDLPVVAIGFYLALFFRFMDSSPAQFRSGLVWSSLFLPFPMVLYAGMNYAWRLHRRTWRYATAPEVIPILIASASSTTIALYLDLVSVVNGRGPFPPSVILLGGFFTFCGFVIARYRFRLLGSMRGLRGLGYSALESPKRVLIYGAGDSGQLLAWRLLTQPEGRRYHIVGFLDDDARKRKMLIHGIRVVGDRHNLMEIIREDRVDLVLITIRMDGGKMRAVLEAVQDTPAQVKIAPNVFDWMSSSNGGPLLREVKAEDLIGRRPADLDRSACSRVLRDKVVLVTGACGSIGSELCHEIIRFNPKQLVALDNNETGLYELDVDMRAQHPAATASLAVADVTDSARIERLFYQLRPEVIFHVAAYKHVPLMEQFPEEAIRVNIGGTRTCLMMARRYGAKRFVLVSSDKAVNPTSVMGATKRLAEILVTGKHDGETDKGTDFVCTAVRFGNVLGSRGSVVPTFARQIELGGPVTVTHPEMTRYFMDLREAASLIVQAAALTQGGDIFMLDMGERIRIQDLARRMIRLRGLRPGVDVSIEYTGIRSGEKVHEELTYADEERQATASPLIFRVNGHPTIPYYEVEGKIDRLIRLASTTDRTRLVAELLELAGQKNALAPDGAPEPNPIAAIVGSIEL